MTRLAGYLIRVFSFDALSLFSVAIVLLFLAQCLRAFDVISVMGQDFLTLVGQTALTMPTLAMAFAHVCVGIGLARGLKTLQASHELHIVHTSRRLPALFGGIATYAVVGTILVLILSNIIEPTTRKAYAGWSASVAADLVSRTLRPNQFIEIAPDVTVVIGSRGPSGELGSFFADDRRNSAMRRTYIASSASVAADGSGYVLQLTDGAIQYLSADQKYSEVTFARYDIAVDRLTGAMDAPTGPDTVTTPDLIAEALASGQLSGAARAAIGARLGEGLRVLATCLLVAGLAAFPHGRRNKLEIPIEMIILLLAFAERAVTAYLRMPDPLLPPSGAVAVAAIGAGILFYKLRGFGPARSREVAA